MILIKDKLKEVNKTTSDYLNWLEDGRKEHNLEHLAGKNIIDIDANNGSSKYISIHPDLMDNLNKFLKE